MKKTSILFLMLSVYTVIIVIAGFGPAYYWPMAQGKWDYHWILHLHSLVFTAWLIFFTYQCFLIYQKRLQQHKKTGQKLGYFAIMLVIVGLITTIIRSRGFNADGNVEKALDLIWVGHRDMLIFSLFFSVALWKKNDYHIHSRFMLSAHVMLMVAAVARIHYYFNPDFPFSFLGIWLLPLIVAFTIDMTRKNPWGLIYVINVLIMLLFEKLMALFIQPTDLLKLWSAF